MIKFIVLITAFSQVAALYQNRIYVLEKSIISLTNLLKSTYDDIFYNQIRLINDFQLIEQYNPEIINLTELANSTINQQFDKYLKYLISIKAKKNNIYFYSESDNLKGHYYDFFKF